MCPGVQTPGRSPADTIRIVRPLEIRNLGRMAYGDALALQRALVADRQAKRIEDQLLLVEHPAVLTLGVRGDGGRSHILATDEQLAERGIGVFETGRGGDVTYHGPGQIVGYPIVDLNPDRRDVHRYVRDIEEVLIRVAADFGVTAQRISGLTGVWVDNEKLAAIGVRIQRWVTSHGFALNVSTNLHDFNLIVPCGISDRGVTSFARLGLSLTREQVEARIIARFAEVFERTPVVVTGEPRPAVAAAEDVQAQP